MHSTDSITPDLDFLRNLVDGGSGRTQYLMGQAFVVGGGLYSFQCISNWLLLVFLPQFPLVGWIVLSAMPTVLFIGYCIFQRIHYGPSNRGNATTRAITAGFEAGGITNIALILIFAPAAFLRDDFSVWLFYPAVVFALQGAAWLVAWKLRRRTWLLVVALGWLVSSVALGALVGTAAYLLAGGAALFFFMLLPGIFMMRSAETPPEPVGATG